MLNIIEKNKGIILIVFSILLFVGLILLYFYVTGIKNDILNKIKEINDKLDDEDDNMINRPYVNQQLQPMVQPMTPPMVQPMTPPMVQPIAPPMVQQSTKQYMNQPSMTYQSPILNSSRVQDSESKYLNTKGEVEPIYSRSEISKTGKDKDKNKNVSFKTEVEEIEETEENEDELDAEIAAELKELEEDEDEVEVEVEDDDDENEDLKNKKE